MAITEGQALPSAALLKVVPGGVEEVDAATYGKGRRIVLFAVPGAVRRRFVVNINQNGTFVGALERA